MARSLRDKILKALEKGGLTAFELSKRLGTNPHYLLSKLEEEGLIKYDFATEKWHLKR